MNGEILLLAVFVVILEIFLFPIQSAMLKCWSINEFVFAPQLLKMKLRGVPYRKVVDGFVALKKEGLDVSLNDVEKLYISNEGHFEQCVQSKIMEGKRHNKNSKI